MRNLILRLGELAIPVGLVAAVSDPSEKLFRTLHAGACKAPVSMRVYCPADARVLEAEETVKAWQVAPGQYLELTRDEVDALTPLDSSVVELNGFVLAGELDPLLVNRRYHLAPAKAAIGGRVYRALVDAMRDLDTVAVTRFTAWNSEQLAAISAHTGRLELQTLHPGEDLVDTAALTDAIGRADAPTALEAELMRDVVDRYTRTLTAADLENSQRGHVRQLLAAKLAGEPIHASPGPASEPPAPPVDLETALRRTLKTAPRRRRRRSLARA